MSDPSPEPHGGVPAHEPDPAGGPAPDPAGMPASPYRAEDTQWPAAQAHAAPAQPSPSKRGALALLGAALVFGVTKFGAVLKVAGLIKGLALLAKFKTLISMIVSVWAYALFWGWKFALGFVLLIFVHEMGHVIVLRAQGVKVSAPMFIPFIGAFVALKEEQRSVEEEAVSALAGPVVGTLGAYACLQVAQLSNWPLLQALAYTGFLLNFFNLIPFLPLDGGRVAGALHPALWGVGAAVAVVLLVTRPSPVLFLVLLLGGMEGIKRWRDRRAGRTGEYYNVPPRRRAAIAGGYVAVAVFCLWGMDVAYLAPPVDAAGR